MSNWKSRTDCIWRKFRQLELAQEVENICNQYIQLRIGIPKILSKNEMKIVLSKMKNYKRS